MALIGKRITPDEGLSDVIGHFYILVTPKESDPETQHLSPSLEMVIVFNFGVPVSFSYGAEPVGARQFERIAIFGPLRKMLNYEIKGGTDLLAIPFIYNGFYRFMSVLNEDRDYGDLTENLALSYTLHLEKLWEYLSATPSPEERVGKLQQYLMNEIPHSEPAAISLLDNIPELHQRVRNPVSLMAEKTALTERTIQLRFKKYVGYSPKELLRFLRFKQVLSFIARNQQSRIDWFEIILKYGYHDQSHLIKDFKHYTGVSPNHFLKLSDEGSFCINRD